jgi:hypothetical protein
VWMLGVVVNISCLYCAAEEYKMPFLKLNEWYTLVCGEFKGEILFLLTCIYNVVHNSIF